MAVIDFAKRAIIESRQYYSNNCRYYGDDYYGNCRSNWYSWGRWVLLACLIVGAFLIFLLFSCITARRRRRLGATPYYGTGWAAHGTPQYTNNQQQQPYYQQQQWGGNQGWNSQPPPQYGASNSYYGGQPKPEETYNQGQQQNGVELQQPNQTYQPQRGGDNVYTPPAGPPPAK